MQGFAGECQGNVYICVQSDRGMHRNVCQGNPGECCAMPGEHMGVGAKCQGNARRTYWSVGIVAGKFWGMQWNGRGTYGNGCKVTRECRGM